MKVLFITSWGRACGIATYSSNLIEQLEAQGVSVEVYCDTKNFNGLARLAKESTADVVHIQHEFGISMPSEPLMSIIAKFRMAGKVVVMTLHTEDKGVNILLDGVLDAAIVHADKFSMADKNTFTPFYKIPHGIPEIRFAQPKEYYRQKYNIPQDACVIGTCGFVSQSRAEMLESFTTALAPLMKQKNLYLHYVTSAHANDLNGAYANMIRASVMSIAAQHGVSDRIIMTADFMDTQEFRERIYTLDMGFVYAALDVASNSGAAADLLSCGVPTIINRSPHFSHVAPYCTVAGNTLQDVVKMVEDCTAQYVSMQKGPTQAIQDIGYSVIARRHITIYQEALTARENPREATYLVAKVSAKPVDEQQPIVLTLPNSMWQVLYMWTRLQGLVDQGYKIKLMLQADGTTDINLLRWCLPGIAGITFTDVGMINDPRLVRLHSRSFSQNMTTDVAAWVREGHPVAELFSFLPTQNQYPMKLGEYAEKKAAEMAQFYNVYIVPIPGHTEELLYECSYLPREAEIVILCIPTRNTAEVPQLIEGFRVKGVLVSTFVEDIRTNLACALSSKFMITGWNELALIRLLHKLPTRIICTQLWEYHLVRELAVEHVTVVPPKGSLYATLIK